MTEPDHAELARLLKLQAEGKLTKGEWRQLVSWKIRSADTMNSKSKGKVGEREWAKFLRAEGFNQARRGQQYAGNPDAPDVVGIPGWHQEVKRVERLNLRDAVAQAVGDAGGQPWFVAHRWNHGQWLVTLPAEKLLELIRETLPK